MPRRKDRTMKTHALFCGIAVLLVAGAAAPAGDLTTSRRDKPVGPRPTFTSHRYELELAKLNTASKIDLAEGGKRQYTVELEGTLRIPEGQEDNVIAATPELRAVSVTDTRKESILKPDKKSRRRRTYRKGTFEYLQDESMEVELDKVELTRDAYRIDRMTLQARALAARRWEYVKLDATPMTHPVDEAGIGLRVIKVALGRRGRWHVEIECTRPRSGPGAPFVGTVAILDGDGRELVSGKIEDGDPLGKESALSAEFTLPAESKPSAVRIGVVSAYDVKTLDFEVKDLIPR
ncbi:MAG: hypothetical protein ACOC8F_07740 [Planctomycetota bacterium]